MTVSNRPPISAAGTPVATAAFSRRAPSRCVASPSSRAAPVTASSSSSGQHRPPDELCVFSTATRADPLVGDLRARLRRCDHELLDAEPAGTALDRLDHQTRMRRRPAVLVDDDVRVPLGDEYVPGPRVELQRDLVRERRRRQEERSLLTEQRRGPLLEGGDRRILATLLVTDDRAGNRRTASRRSAAWRCRSEARSPRHPTPLRGGRVHVGQDAAA